MDDGRFQWNDGKAEKNRDMHGVSFEAARLVFQDPFALEWLDESESYGEDRYVIIGEAEHHLLYVAFTMRGEAIRLISARLAEPLERRRYFDDDRT